MLHLLLGCIIKNNGVYHLIWRVNSSGFCQLLNTDGSKFCGTPSVERAKKLVVGKVEVRQFNGAAYLITKKGVFSTRTGERMVSPSILRGLKVKSLSLAC